MKTTKQSAIELYEFLQQPNTRLERIYDGGSYVAKNYLYKGEQRIRDTKWLINDDVLQHLKGSVNKRLEGRDKIIIEAKPGGEIKIKT